MTQAELGVARPGGASKRAPLSGLPAPCRNPARRGAAL